MWMDEIMNQQNTKQKHGAIGFFTNGAMKKESLHRGIKSCGNSVYSSSRISYCLLMIVIIILIRRSRARTRSRSRRRNYDFIILSVDAFTSKLFGNPAAVVPLEKWLDDDTLQNIAAKTIYQTAFFIREGEYYHIRWMTPVNEVPLGHATLASAHVIFNFIEKMLPN